MRRQKSKVDLIVLAVFAVLFLAFGTSVLLTKQYRILWPAQDVNRLETYQVLSEGTFARGEIYAVIDYAASDENGYYFMIPTGDSKITLMYVNKADSEPFFALSEATWDYLEDRTEGIECEPIESRGVLYESDETLEQDTVDYLEASGYADAYLDKLTKTYVTSYIYTYIPKGRWLSKWQWIRLWATPIFGVLSGITLAEAIISRRKKKTYVL